MGSGCHTAVRSYVISGVIVIIGFIVIILVIVISGTDAHWCSRCQYIWSNDIILLKLL